MNRRSILKSGLALPLIGLIPKNSVSAKDVSNGFNPDSIVADRGWDEYVESIKNELIRMLGKDEVTAYISRAGRPTLIPASFLCNYGPMFTVYKNDYNRNTVEGRKFLVHTLWIDFLWSLNDDINERISLIRRVQPDYDPDDYRC